MLEDGKRAVAALEKLADAASNFAAVVVAQHELRMQREAEVLEAQRKAAEEPGAPGMWDKLASAVTAVLIGELAGTSLAEETPEPAAAAAATPSS